jgi:phosphoserine phosphatase
VPRFAALVLDVDSTLTRVEGIEWLARRRGQNVARAVAEMTQHAMTGVVGLDDVYARRLALVKPSHADLTALAEVYEDGLMPGAKEAVSLLRHHGVRMEVVSGGIFQAVLPFARSLGFDDAHIHAVPVTLTSGGEYEGYDATSPLAKRGGKPELVRQLGLPRLILALGDGNTDAELKTASPSPIDGFAAFVGVAARPTVVAVADYIVNRFADLPPLVLGEGTA